MKVNHSKSIRFAIATALAVGTCQIAGAVGLGPISVNSHIGEPLQASIRVNGLSASDAANTKIKLADAAAYQSRGIAKLPSHNNLRFSLRPAGNGYIITVRSNERIREPFINFLLSMNSGGKEIVREYAVFLDPATNTTIPVMLAEPVNEVAPPGVESGLLNIKPASSTSIGWQGRPAAAPAKPAPSVAKSAPAIPVEPVVWNGRTYGPVQPGETLYSIANKVRPSENYSIQVAMRQIFHANRSAFSSHNLSSLMAGYTLKIPEFRQGAMPKSKRGASLQPAPQHKATPAAADNGATADAAESHAAEMASTDTAQVADNAQQAGMAVQNGLSDSGNDAVDTSNSDDAVVRPALLNSDDADASKMDDSADNAGQVPVENVTNMGETDNSTMDDGKVDEALPSDETLANDEDALVVEEMTAGSDDAMPETVVVDETADVMPPVDAQPALIEEDSGSNGQDNAIEVITPEPEAVEVVVPTNSEPPVPMPVPEKAEDEGFLFTTYAILPMWQWLAISSAALVLIALLLFRQRRKAVDMGDEEDGLDADEMEAVLAQINAIDDDIHDDLNDAPVSHHDDVPDEQIDDINTGVDIDEDIFAQDSVIEGDSDVSLHKSSQTEGHVDEPVDDFLFDDEVPMQADEVADADVQSSTTAESNTESTVQPIEDDFFADDDIDWEELGVSTIPEEKETPAASSKLTSAVLRDRTTPNDTDWLDDLVFEGEEPPVRKFKPASTMPSSDEMEINLDLASSFIATGHGERAISWLEEVIEMGSAAQRERAEELLAKVRNT